MAHGAIRVRFLGQFEVWIDGAPIDIGGPKQRTVLAMLLLAGGRRVSTDVLLDRVWGADGEGAARSLRTNISTLRRLLGDAAAISAVDNGYVIDAPGLSTDVDDVRSLLADARDIESGARQVELLERAWSTWRGPALGGVAEECAAEERVPLDALRRECLVALADAANAAGVPERVLGLLEAEVLATPLDERLVGALMTALYASGRPADALAAYRTLERSLGQELGVVPGPELQRLEQQILGHAMEPLGRGLDPTTFPLPMIELVGREAQLADVLARRSMWRLLTITGPGGVGKTQFSLELAHRLRGEFGQARWFVDLSTLFDERELDSVIASSLRIQRRLGTTSLDNVATFLRTRPALLVIDNCEHLAAAVAAAITRLAQLCPELTVIATSRVALHIRGEVELVLPPLAVPFDAGEVRDEHRSALDLLLRRAPSSFAASAANSADLIELCRRLDGLPLAIELAASQLGALAPAEIVAELQHRLDVLERPAFAGPSGSARQGTLVDAIEWSVELITPMAKRVLVRLGVMAGWFTAEDAAAVAGTPMQSVLVALRELVAHSLLVADTSGAAGRYRLLETIRQFASERIGADDEATRAAHASRFADVAERSSLRLRGPDERAAVQELASAHDNIRAAVIWSLDHGEVGFAARIVASLSDWGYFRFRYELAEWAARTVALLDAEHPLWFQVSGTASRGAWATGRFDDAVRLAERVAATLGPAFDAPTIGRSGHPLDVAADVAMYRSDVERAEAHYRRALESAVAREDPVRLTWVTYYLSVVAAVRGDWQQAAEWAQRALDASRPSQNQTAISQGLYATALAAKHSDPSLAITMFDEAIRVADSVGNAWFGGIARMERASTRAKHGDPLLALDDFEEVIDHWNRAGDLTQLRLTWRYLVPALVAAGRVEEAAVLTGALIAERTSRMTHPNRSTQDKMLVALGPSQYQALTTRGALLPTWELVVLSRSAIRGARDADRNRVAT